MQLKTLFVIVMLLSREHEPRQIQIAGFTSLEACQKTGRELAAELEKNGVKPLLLGCEKRVYAPKAVTP